MQEYRPLFLVVTCGLLGAAFYFTYRRPRSATRVDRGARPQANATARLMSFNKILLWVVTAVVALFLFFPQSVTGLLAPQDEFTAGMERTVISIEGMT